MVWRLTDSYWLHQRKLNSNYAAILWQALLNSHHGQLFNSSRCWSKKLYSRCRHFTHFFLPPYSPDYNPIEPEDLIQFKMQRMDQWQWLWQVTGHWYMMYDMQFILHKWLWYLLVCIIIWYVIVCPTSGMIMSSLFNFFLILVRIAFWRSSYSSVVTPHSFRLCHLSNLWMHSKQRVILFPGRRQEHQQISSSQKMTSFVVSPKIHAY